VLVLVEVLLETERILDFTIHHFRTGQQEVVLVGKDWSHHFVVCLAVLVAAVVDLLQALILKV
jgi:hypothetical protein